jgi:hypothetical protein
MRYHFMDMGRLLGWIEHCEREHPSQATCIPSWLCPYETLKEAVDKGWIEKKSMQNLVPRLDMSGIVYGLTQEGRVQFYFRLPDHEEVVN